MPLKRNWLLLNLNWKKTRLFVIKLPQLRPRRKLRKLPKRFNIRLRKLQRRKRPLSRRNKKPNLKLLMLRMR